jgi:hypothetical protein
MHHPGVPRLAVFSRIREPAGHSPWMGFSAGAPSQVPTSLKGLLAAFDAAFPLGRHVRLVTVSSGDLLVRGAEKQLSLD